MHELTRNSPEFRRRVQTAGIAGIGLTFLVINRHVDDGTIVVIDDDADVHMRLFTEVYRTEEHVAMEFFRIEVDFEMMIAKANATHR